MRGSRITKSWTSILVASLVAHGHASQHCSEVTFEVQASAEHYIWQDPPALDDELNLVDFLKQSLWGGPPAAVQGMGTVSGTFQLSGTFCQPNQQQDGIQGDLSEQAPIAANRSETLQVLLPGNTFHKGIWSCYGYDKRCDWQTYATSQGHYTLALDRLGSGNSTRPEDTIDTMQAAIQVEITHQIINTIRDRENANLPAAMAGKQFDKIVLGGYSYGAILGLGLSRLYPEDIDAYVLTGYSGRLHLPPGVLLMHFIPAARVTEKPQFSDLPLGYLTAATEGTSTHALYRGDYDPALARLDWLNRDVVTPGEYASLGAVSAVSGYRGPVMVVAGDQDDIFCNPKYGTCTESLQTTKELFPDATEFSTFVAPKTSHGVLTHNSAPEIHRAVHDWLKEVLSK